MKRTPLVLAALALVLGGAGRASADYIPFSGSGFSGTVVPSPGAGAWSVQHSNSWGIPGVDQGVRLWTRGGTETAFTVTFTNLPAGVTIAPGGNTQFSTPPASATSAWAPSFSPDGRTVTFTAPAGGGLTPGTLFHVTVSFTGNVGPGGVAFAGAFDPQDAPSAPEPSGLALLGTATTCLAGYFGWRRRRKSASACLSS
jgi:hypothetical protein